jgi:nitroreductase
MKTIDSIKNRYSTVLFDSSPVDKEKIEDLFEAARWAPSSSNIQPWRFFYSTRENKTNYDEFVMLLFPGNQMWAQNAYMLIVTVAEIINEKGPNRHAFHDTGLATADLLLRATELGLATHPMGGFDVQKAKELLKLSVNFEPVAIIAVGYPGDLGKADEEIKQKELSRRIRKRKELREIAFKLD